MSSFENHLDRLPQFEIDAHSEGFCLNVNHHGVKARILVQVKEMQSELLTGKTRVEISYIISNPIDDAFEIIVTKI